MDEKSTVMGHSYRGRKQFERRLNISSARENKWNCPNVNRNNNKILACCRQEYPFKHKRFLLGKEEGYSGALDTKRSLRVLSLPGHLHIAFTAFALVNFFIVAISSATVHLYDLTQVSTPIPILSTLLYNFGSGNTDEARMTEASVDQSLSITPLFYTLL